MEAPLRQALRTAALTGDELFRCLQPLQRGVRPVDIPVMSVSLWIALAAGLTVVGLLLLRRDETVRMPDGMSAGVPTGFSIGVPDGVSTGVPGAISTGIADRSDRESIERDPRLPKIPLEDRDNEFMGPWSEGHSGFVRVAFSSYERSINIIVGDFDADLEQLTETYLSQVSDTQVLPMRGASNRISTAIGNEGAALDERFYLNATGGDYAQLRTRGVRDALLRLSGSIREIAIFEEGAGVDLMTEVTATSESIAADLKVAIAIYRALN